MAPTLEVLQESGIEIEQDPGDIIVLPPYAKELRDMLLNFEKIIPLQKVCSSSFNLGTLSYSE